MRANRHIHMSPLSVRENWHDHAVGSNRRRVARGEPFGEGTMHARNVRRDAGQKPKCFDRLIHAHAAAVKDARAFAGGGFEEFGLDRRIDDVGGPMRRLERGHGDRIAGKSSSCRFAWR